MEKDKTIKISKEDYEIVKDIAYKTRRTVKAVVSLALYHFNKLENKKQ